MILPFSSHLTMKNPACFCCGLTYLSPGLCGVPEVMPLACKGGDAVADSVTHVVWSNLLLLQLHPAHGVNRKTEYLPDNKNININKRGNNKSIIMTE